jgi:hypothetical protein
MGRLELSQLEPVHDNSSPHDLMLPIVTNRQLPLGHMIPIEAVRRLNLGWNLTNTLIFFP